MNIGIMRILYALTFAENCPSSVNAMKQTCVIVI